MFLLIACLISFTVAGAQHLSDQDVVQERLKAAPTPTHFQPSITAKPLQARATTPKPTTVTDVEWVDGGVTFLSTVGSVCGFVTTDIHWPVQCYEGEFCFHEGAANIACCQTTTTYPFTSTVLYTVVTTDRTLATHTSISTRLETTWQHVSGSNCTVAGYETCYNYNQTASCTDTCTTTGLVCSDPSYPACVTLYSQYENATSIGSSVSYGTTSYGISYYCDTDGYSLQWMNYGYSPSVQTTYTYTSAAFTSTEPTFTPTPVEFSRTQASRAGTEAQEALMQPSTTSTSAAHILRGGISIYMLACWVLLALLIR